MKVRRVIAILALLFVAARLYAEPKLPGFFGDNMVLQREKPVKIWGWADSGEEMTVTFAGQSCKAVAGPDGSWLVKLDPMKAASEAQTLTVKSNKAEAKIAFTNVVVGDVWLCSGQSNMEWSLGRVTDSAKEREAANYPLIRHIKFAHVTADSPQRDIKSSWTVCSPETAAGFTAVGYFFGRHLHEELGVPIGLIGSNWGGTFIEPWLSVEGLKAVPELKDLYESVAVSDPTSEEGKAAYKKAFAEMRLWLDESEAALGRGGPIAPMPPMPKGPEGKAAPCRIFNAMMSPITQYGIRGAIWYQGESNGKEGVSYFHKKRALIEGWRKLWGYEFPFYFVQLANFQQPTDDPAGGNGWAMLREAQRMTLSVPGTGMAVAIDLADAKNPGNIHPGNKQDVGKRLALWALAKEYGKELVCSGPLYRSHSIEGNIVRIKFDYAGSGLMVAEKNGLDPAAEVQDGVLKRFAIAGADKKWVWADARIDGNDVVVSSPEVTEPAAVRYAFSMNPAGCNLYNRDGLPASPFRTDDW